MTTAKFVRRGSVMTTMMIAAPDVIALTGKPASRRIELALAFL